MTLPVSAIPTSEGWQSPGISFEDFGRMKTAIKKLSGERRLPTPDWALSNRLLRKVLVYFMEERAGFRRPQKGTLKERLDLAKGRIIAKRPRMMETMDKLCREYVEIKQRGLRPDISDQEWNDTRKQPFMKFAESEARYEDETVRRRKLEIQIEGIDTFLRYSVHGGADVVAAIVYLYYRMGYDSVNVAAELNLKPNHVRQTLYRLHRTVAAMEKLGEVPSRNTSKAKVAARAKKAANRSGTRVPKKHFTPPIFQGEQ